MENNAPNLAIKKQEKLLQEISQLEKQTSAIKDKLRTLENEEKLEVYQKNFLEVKKDNLSRSTEFYQDYSKKINTKLAETLAVHLKLSMTNEYYDKLLEMYREKYLQQENFNTSEEMLGSEGNLYFQKQMDILRKQVEKLTSKIEINSTAIKSLLKDLDYVVE